VFSTNTFSSNTYHHRNPPNAVFYTRAGRVNLARAQSIGQERLSTIDTNVRGRAWNCNAWGNVMRPAS
jgi:hypothetical protein